MSLNELLRDNNSNKWANLNVQSVNAVSETVTTLNATTVNSVTENVTTLNATTSNSIQDNTFRSIIKATDNADDVIDMSKDLATARLVSKKVSTGELQPYEITSCCMYWRKQLPGDANEIVLAGTQLNTLASLLPVFPGRHKMVFATILANGTGVTAQSGGLIGIDTSAGVGIYDLTFNAFSNRIYCTAVPAQNGFIGYATCEPISNTVVRVSIYNSLGALTPSIFTIQAFGDA